jgi:hypothetical protein
MTNSSRLKSVFSPYIIGTMNQATGSTTNLQLHHNFRWVLCANHMEPVQGFLGRYLRRRMAEASVKDGSECTRLDRIVQWIPLLWQQLNRLLETHNCTDVTIGQSAVVESPIRCVIYVTSPVTIICRNHMSFGRLQAHVILRKITCNDAGLNNPSKFKCSKRCTISLT